MRFIVAQTNTRRLADAPCEPLPVGVARWPGSRLTVVVKATYGYDPAMAQQKLRLAPQQDPIAPLCATSVADLVTFKPRTDVVVIGHAYAANAQERIDARLQFDEIDRSFCAVGSKNDRMALSEASLRGSDGTSRTDPVGPCGPFHDVLGAEDGGPILLHDLDFPDDKDDEHEDEQFDWDDLTHAGDLYRTGGVSFASVEQRCTENCATGVITLTGLCPGGETRILEMPEHTPIIVVETSEADYWVTAYCDTVTIDTDRCTVTLVWRGQVPYRGQADHVVQRIVVSLERDDEDMRPMGVVYRELQRGIYSRAVEEADFEEEPPKDEEDPELLLAKYETWGLAPETTIDLEHYAAVSAALADGGNRGEVLAHHKLDEDGWALEEQAWLSRLSAAVGSDDELVRRYDRLMRTRRESAKRGDA